MCDLENVLLRILSASAGSCTGHPNTGAVFMVLFLAGMGKGRESVRPEDKTHCRCAPAFLMSVQEGYPMPNKESLPMSKSFPMLLVILLAGGLQLLCPATLSAQEGRESLGTLQPQAKYEATTIAVAAFGRSGGAPVEFETIPRVIRRDLELTGFFKMPENQQIANTQNVFDVKRGTVNFESWQKLGVQHYLMGEVIQDASGSLRVRGILYDIESQKLIFSRYFEGSTTDVRLLAHRISDEVVRYLKFTEGFASTKFLFVSSQVPGIKEISLMDSDGFNQRVQTHYNKICTTPAWGANGTEIYYTSYHGNRANIYGQMLSSNATWTVAAYGGTNHAPDWSQATERLVMALSKDGNTEIYSSRRDGKNLRRLTSTRSTDGSPGWSPDGGQIAYASDEAGGVHIFVMSADGTGKRRLTTRGSWNDAPAWCPDGQRIAFVSRIEGRNDIFLCDASGSANSYRRLTKDQGDNESPSWAPNGRHLAFASDRSGRWQIYLMLDDGSNQRALTTTGSNILPAWGPAPK